MPLLSLGGGGEADRSSCVIIDKENSFPLLIRIFSQRFASHVTLDDVHREGTHGFDPFNLLSDRVQLDPYSSYERLRRLGTVVWNPRLGFWMILGYDEVRKVLTNPDSFSSRLKGRPRDSLYGALTMIFTDPPEHDRLRQLVGQAFSQATVHTLETKIQHIVNELIATALEKNEFDAVETWTSAIPMTVISELLGVPNVDRAYLKACADAIVSAVGRDRTTMSRRNAAFGMREYFHEVLRKQKGVRGLVAFLADAAPSFHATEEEIVSMCMLLVVAGYETTSCFLGNLLVCFLEHQDEWQMLLDHPSGSASIVEEALRLNGPVVALRRISTKPTEVGGIMVPSDQNVTVLVSAANHDDRTFVDPANFIVDRKEAGRAIPFGAGPHYCLGASLARTESRLFLESLAKEMKERHVGLSKVSDTPIRSLFVRGPQSLQVRQTPRT